VKFHLPFKRRRERERELDEELRAHLAMAVGERIEQGEDPAEAEANARREFGNVPLVKEVTRDQWGWRWLETLLQDLRYGLRQLRRNLGFTIVAIVTLALGIGANTAIFSLLDPLLLRDLPVYRPHELVCMSSAGSLGKAGIGYLSEIDAYYSYRDQAQGLSGVAAYGPSGAYKVSVDGNTSTAEGRVVSGNYFTVLGVHPSLGSFFTRETSQNGLGNPVVISFDFWRRQFKGDREAIGKVISIDNAAYTIFGVAPPGFFGTVVGESPDVYLSLDGHLSQADRQRAAWVTIIARRKPGISISQLRAGLYPLFTQIVRKSELPEVEKRESMARLVVTPASRGLSGLRQKFGLAAKILMGIVGLVLLIACANAANLFLAYGAGHRREMAVRLALGAGRWRLTRLLLARSALIAIAGAIIGLLVAQWTDSILLGSLSTAGSPAVLRAGLSVRLLLFTVVITGLTALLAGLVPSIFPSRVNFNEELAAHPGAGFLSQRSKVSNTFLLAQISVCAILLAGAGLLLRSLVILETFNPGFDRDHVLAVSLHDTAQGSTPIEQTVSYKELLDRVRSLPGVSSGAYSAFLPISSHEMGINIEVEGYTLGQGETANILFSPVSPGYFETLGITVLMGRGFEEQDATRPFRVAIINQAMAHRFFGSRNPIGKHFKFVEGNRPPVEIIGVVANSKYNNLREQSQDFFYVPVAYGQTLEIRSAGAPGAIVDTVRKAVQVSGGSIEVAAIQTLRAQIDESLHQDRLVAALCSVFGALALVLVCIGLYGVLSFSIARRTHEIGIRMALGAEKRDVLRMVLGQGMKLALIGIAIGIGGALALTRLLSSLLYGVKPTDPLTFVGVSLILMAVALLACYIPARRAAKVDPMVALRYE